MNKTYFIYTKGMIVEKYSIIATRIEIIKKELLLLNIIVLFEKLNYFKIVLLILQIENCCIARLSLILDSRLVKV